MPLYPEQFQQATLIGAVLSLRRCKLRLNGARFLSEGPGGLFCPDGHSIFREMHVESALQKNFPLYNGQKIGKIHPPHATFLRNILTYIPQPEKLKKKQGFLKKISIEN